MVDKTRAAIARAEHAQALLNDPIFMDAWAEVEKEIITKWMSSTSDDELGRESCYRELHGLRAVRARLERAINAGKLAEKELEHLKDGH